MNVNYQIINPLLRGLYSNLNCISFEVMFQDISTLDRLVQVNLPRGSRGDNNRQGKRFSLRKTYILNLSMINATMNNYTVHVAELS